MEGLASALVSHGPVKVYADVFQDPSPTIKNQI